MTKRLDDPRMIAKASQSRVSASPNRAGKPYRCRAGNGGHAAVIAGVLLAATLGAQAPAENPAPAEAARARVRGLVVDARGGALLKGATVIVGRRRQTTASGEGDVQGRFDIANAPSGEQPVAAFKAGYLDYQGLIRIPAGQEVKDVRIEMNRAAVVTGRVTGAGGEPLVEAQVGLFQRTFERGRLRLRGLRSNTTDDRGIFRLWGLPPGEYFVAVDAPGERGPHATAIFTGTRVYYPNAPTADGATPLRLDWGQVQEEINLEPGPPAATRVEGFVSFRQAGGDCSSCDAELLRQEGGLWVETGAAPAVSHNIFSMLGLAVGHYAVRVQSWDRVNGSQSFGSAEFTTAQDRTTQVVVNMHNEQTISGRVMLIDPPESVAGPKAGEPWHAAVELEPEEGDPRAPAIFNRIYSDVSSASAEAAFELKGVPGRYRLHVFRIPEGGYVRGASVAGRPLDGPRLEVPNSGLEDLVISVAYDAGKIAGKVDLGKTLPDTGLLPPLPVVRLISETVPSAFLGELYSRPKSDATFEIDGLPPGRYRAFAAAQEDAWRIEDPAVARKLSAWSKPVEVHSGQTTTVDLQPAPRIAQLE